MWAGDRVDGESQQLVQQSLLVELVGLRREFLTFVLVGTSFSGVIVRRVRYSSSK